MNSYARRAAQKAAATAFCPLGFAIRNEYAPRSMPSLGFPSLREMYDTHFLLRVANRYGERLLASLFHSCCRQCTAAQRVTSSSRICSFAQLIYDVEPERCAVNDGQDADATSESLDVCGSTRR